MTKESIHYTKITISKFYASENVTLKCTKQNQIALQRYMDKLIIKHIGFNIPFLVNDRTTGY